MHESSPSCKLTSATETIRRAQQRPDALHLLGLSCQRACRRSRQAAQGRTGGSAGDLTRGHLRMDGAGLWEAAGLGETLDVGRCVGEGEARCPSHGTC